MFKHVTYIDRWRIQKIMYRVEDKFCCGKKDMHVLESRLSPVLESDHMVNEYGYTITSIYFDDIFDTCLKETIDGNFKREKYRIRIYNNSFDVIKLEVKFKEYNRIKKKACTISKDEMLMLLNAQCIERGEQNVDNPIVLFNMAIKNKGLRPKVIVEYDRRAFIFEHGNVRITLDRNLRYSKQCKNFGKESITYRRIGQWEDVLEVKYDEFLPDFIAQLLEIGDLKRTSFSKYQICRLANEEERNEYK